MKKITATFLLFYLMIMMAVEGNTQQHKPDQLSRDIHILKQQTVSIMNKLAVKIRPNIAKDGPLKILMDKATSPNESSFIEGRFFSTSRTDLSYRYYPNATITLKPIYYTTVFKNKDTTHLFRVLAHSALVHELCHFLQASTQQNQVGTSKPVDYITYVNQPHEIEAQAVQAYYFLSFYHKEKLDNILLVKESKLITMKRLINAFLLFTETSPYQFPITKQEEQSILQ